MLSSAFPVQILSILQAQLKSHFIQEICPDNTSLIYWSPSPLNSYDTQTLVLPDTPLFQALC